MKIACASTDRPLSFAEQVRTGIDLRQTVWGAGTFDVPIDLTVAGTQEHICPFCGRRVTVVTVPGKEREAPLAETKAQWRLVGWALVGLAVLSLACVAIELVTLACPALLGALGIAFLVSSVLQKKPVKVVEPYRVSIHSGEDAHYMAEYVTRGNPRPTSWSWNRLPEDGQP
jgi:hypothetical protein